MPSFFFKKILRLIIFILLFFLGGLPFLFSQGHLQGSNADPNYNSTDKLTVLQRQARAYRNEGFRQQSLGNLDAAMSFYQKAIELDPAFAVAYNDLGIGYEMYGAIDRAEESYLKAIRLNSNLLSAYSNLALLYENKRDLDKAFFYWTKRADLGSPDDPWTQKAKNRASDIMQVMPSLRQDLIEREMFVLVKEAAEKKRIKQLKNLEGSKRYLQAATQFYNKRDYKQALDKLKLSFSLNPDNKDALALADKVRLKLKEQEKEANVKKLQEHFNDGMRYYQEDNLQAARQEFEKIVGLTATPQKN